MVHNAIHYINIISTIAGISQLLNLFIGTPRICNFISLLIVWMRSFSKKLPSVNFAEIRCSFSLFSVKNAKTVQL